MLLDYVETPARQAASLDVLEHRPWPLPAGPWIQGQTWERLCFLHWRVPAGELQEFLPDGLALDTYEETGWLGITPFRLTGLRVRGLPPVPRLSTSLEVNVRTYVTYGGKPGIWFFSLDAENRFFVGAARQLYRLPYHHADMSWHLRGDRVDYRSARAGARFHGVYEPTTDSAPPALGTLEYFLTERYCLYTEHEGRLWRAEIHHPPWPLQEAEADLDENTMSPLELEGEALAHHAARQDVVIWPLEQVET